MVTKNIRSGASAGEVAGLVSTALDPSALYITGHTINDGGIAIGAC